MLRFPGCFNEYAVDSAYRDVMAGWRVKCKCCMAHLVSRVTIIFQAFSLLALLVMNLDRYLATSYPLFHRTSVTKGSLLTFRAILMMIEVCSALMSLNDDVTSFPAHLIIVWFLLQ